MRECVRHLRGRGECDRCCRHIWDAASEAQSSAADPRREQISWPQVRIMRFGGDMPSRSHFLSRSHFAPGASGHLIVDFDRYGVAPTDVAAIRAQSEFLPDDRANQVPSRRRVSSQIVRLCWSPIAAKQEDDASFASICRREITTMELVACW
jgi:hypothetical protein